jgi:transposase-like protein
LFGGTVGKGTVSRTWRKVKGDWDAWNSRSLAEEPIVRLILDGTVVRVRLDRKATSISLLVVLGVRADGQKVLLTIKSTGGESAEVWRTALDDLIKRGLRRPDFLIVDGAPGLDKAIAAPWPTAWRKLAIACSPSRAYHRANGAVHARPMRSSGCTRSSSGGSKPKPCCRRPTPLR